MSISIVNKSHNALDIYFSETKMTVVLKDGREISIPLEWFPKLRTASPEQLKYWRFIGEGEGIHWNELDEDISIEGLIR